MMESIRSNCKFIKFWEFIKSTGIYKTSWKVENVTKVLKIIESVIETFGK
jgi:hypothetical protein